MQPGINIEDVKKYNASLREYKDKSAKLRAEIDFSKAELERQCKELTAELGIEVTPDNVQEVLEERVKKIQNTMSVGNEILERIKMEEARSSTASTNSGMGAIPSDLTPTQMPGFVPGVAPTTPVAGGVQQTTQFQAPIAPGIPTPETVQNTPWGSMSGGELPNLPNIFGNN